LVSLGVGRWALACLGVALFGSWSFWQLGVVNSLATASSPSHFFDVSTDLINPDVPGISRRDAQLNVSTSVT
jgi:hypothetical protein